jgi:hypothetical protein
MLMARQVGPIYLSGTVGGVTFYRRESGYFARRKTSLNKERFYSDRAFGRSRAAANVFGDAAKIASQVYQMLPREKRGHGVIGRLSGAANRLLHDGKSKEEVAGILIQQYLGIAPVAEKAQTAPNHNRGCLTPERLLEELTASVPGKECSITLPCVISRQTRKARAPT